MGVWNSHSYSRPSACGAPLPVSRHFPIDSPQGLEFQTPTFPSETEFRRLTATTSLSGKVGVWNSHSYSRPSACGAPLPVSRHFPIDSPQGLEFQTPTFPSETEFRRLTATTSSSGKVGVWNSLLSCYSSTRIRCRAIRSISTTPIAPSGPWFTRELPQECQGTSSTWRRCSESVCSHARPRRPDEGRRAA